MLTVDVQQFRDGGKQHRWDVAEQLRIACLQTGFFGVSHHNVPQKDIENVFSTIKSFFCLPLTEKQSPQVSTRDYRGYLAVGRFGGEDPTRPEVSEAFKLYRGPDDSYADPGPPMPPNLWPNKPIGFADAILTYWRALNGLRDVLLQMFALALALPEEYFLQSFSRSMTNMTLLHYPCTDDNRNAYGAGPHTDTDVLTILYPDPVGGLVMQARNGEWNPVISKPGELLINIGDMMQIWSGGRFVSTPHYVVNHSGKDRYAFPYFAAPNPETVVEPATDPVEGFNLAPIHVAKIGEYVRALECPETSLGPQKSRLRIR
jgi:isopenicillin N synthase-like dioxygenase